MPKLRPIGNRVLVDPQTKTETESGIIIPDTAEKETQMGKVLAVGDGPRSPLTGEKADMGLSEGDYVMYARFSGQELRLGSEEVLALREEDIIAVLELGEDEDETLARVAATA